MIKREDIITLILFIAYVVCIVMIIYPTEDLIAYKCPEEDKVQFLEHTVIYVVLDVQSRPCKDMLIEIICNSEMQHNVTQNDGSCSFRQSGHSNYMIRVYNKTLDVQQEFRIYPVKSCYSIVVGGIE